MGNLFAECRRYGLDQCTLCTEVLAAGHGQPQTSTSGAAHAQRQAAAAGAGQHEEYQPINMSEADMMAQAMRLSRLEHERTLRGSTYEVGDRVATDGAQQALDDAAIVAAMGGNYASGGANGSTGPPTEGDHQYTQALRRSNLEEEARERARLLEEQQAEYEESLRIDQQREAERQCRLKEEAEAQRLEEEKAAKEAEAAAETQARIARLLKQAEEKLLPEPAEDAPDRIKVALKTPDGRRLQRTFSKHNEVSQIYYFVDLELGEGLFAQGYRLVSAMPRHVYEDRGVTLQEAGLQGLTLLIEPIDDD